MSVMDAATLTTLKDLTARLVDEDSFRAVAESLRAGASGTIDGAWGSAKALAAAGLAEFKPTLMVVVVPHVSDVDAMIDDLRSFASSVPIVLPALDEIGRKNLNQVLKSEEAFGQRTAVLKALAGDQPPRLMVTTIQALLQPFPTQSRINEHSRRLEKGGEMPRDEFAAWLIDHGWDRRDGVELPGEFSIRGGILDLYTHDNELPIRVEYFGDEIDSIREFSLETQRSVRELDVAIITALNQTRVWQASCDGSEDVGNFAQLVPHGTWFALVEPTDIRDEGKQYLNRLEDTRGMFSVDGAWRQITRHPTVTITNLPHASVETQCRLAVESIERFTGDVNKVKDELDRVTGSDQLLIACHNEGEEKRLGELFAECEVRKEGRLQFTIGRLSAGFRWITVGVVTVSDYELFGRTDIRPATPRRKRFMGRAIDSFLDLKDGDYVVHLGHGIGIFRGMKMLEKNDQFEEHLTIEFADKVLVYVPASKIELVQKYVGSTKTAPRLSKIGGVSWENKKKAVQRAVQDLAGELIDVHAKREMAPGISFPPDTEWMKEFEASFPYVETDDQMTAIEQIRTDMETARPMDRLLCGDVGYGKTELAIRAAFKAVDFGRQVAVLVPTTVLAQQHYRTFCDRMAEYPFVIECMSRFQTRAEQKDIIKRCEAGGVDILIGTHRIVSPDVKFADLGLIVIDEEQRFGVVHKERLKHIRSQVDVLTMTATPIPRTLHSALLGIRDISNLETPPENRLAVETRITRFEREMIRHAILRELNRGGQVYFVHNRVKDIRRVEQKLLEIVPEASVAIIHGQMPEDDIERGMYRFINREADILLATTIIESGLDIPSANTMFIDEADKYGLADMHQLRGRVGRSHHRAYCYLLVDESKSVRPDAQKRLRAIEEFSQLGSGFKIALRDLEIRGAGNILGSQQSGHIAAVGYELYCHLLENAVRALKKQPLKTHMDVTIELPWQAYFPVQYMPGERHRIETYRKLATIRDLNVLDDFNKELEDRFGPIPQFGRNLIDLANLRILAQIWQIEAIRPSDNKSLMLRYRNSRRINTLVDLRKDKLKVVDAKSAYLPVPPSKQNAAGYASLLKQILQPN